MGKIRYNLLNLLPKDVLDKACDQLEKGMKQLELANKDETRKYNKMYDKHTDFVNAIWHKKGSYHLKPREHGWYLLNDED